VNNSSVENNGKWYSLPCGERDGTKTSIEHGEIILSKL